MDRAEGAGLFVAALGHAALFGLLSVGFLATPNPMVLKPTPIEVSLTDDVGLVSESPDAAKVEPAAKLAEELGPVEPVPPPPTPDPAPAEKPDPKPPAAAPAPAPQPVKRPEKPKAAAPTTSQNQRPTQRAVKATGRLDGLLDGLTDKPSPSKSTLVPAAQIGAAVKSSIGAEIGRQLRPHWRSPTGADVELLRTIVELRLNPDGSLAGEPRVIRQDGVNASNRSQADLHKERAIKAIKLAAPFKNLPPEYYEYWKRTGPAFDKRLDR